MENPRARLLYCRPGRRRFVLPPAVELPFFQVISVNELKLRYIQAYEPGPDAPLFFRMDVRPVSDSRPVLIVDAPGGMVVLDGHARLTAASRAKQQLPAVVYPPSTDASEAARIAIMENAATLSTAEKIIALDRTAHFVGVAATTEVPDSLLDSYGRLFGRPLSAPMCAKLRSAAHWPSEQLQVIHDRLASLEHVLPLVDLSVQERRVILELAARVKMSAGETKRIARLLFFARGNKAFDFDEWAASLDEKSKGADLVRSLTATLQPHLTKRGDQVAGVIKKMKLPTGLRITAPENLEGDSFSCYFRFSRAEEFDQYARVLASAADAGLAKAALDALNAPDADQQTTDDE